MGLEKKRMSRRVPLRKKYKLKKKLADHNRKLRKAAKKNKSFVQKKLNKAMDSRIPNTFPFKEEILKNLKEKKELRVEENKMAQKEARHKEQDKKRKLSANPDLHIYAAQSMEKDLAFTLKDAAATIQDIYTKESKDNSMQAYYHEFKKVVEAADVIIEVLDARDPMGCRCPDVENTIATKYPNKKVILLLNKIDLVPRANVEKWMAYLRNSYPTVAFKSSTQRKGKISQSETKFAKSTSADMQGSESLGGDALLQLLKHYARTGAVKTSITVGLVGFPNVGKSSVINSLCRVRAAKVGATPGVTKSAQEIHLDKRVKLLDTPGIVFPKANDVSDDIILRNVVKLEQVADPVSPVNTILKRCNKHVMLSIYKIPDFSTPNEFLIHIARKNGKLMKGGIPNINQAARIVLQDWTGGKIPFYTEPPAVAPDVHVGASIVTQFAPDFDVNQARVLAALDTMDDVELHSTSMGATKPIPVDEAFTYQNTGDDNDDNMSSSNAAMDEDDDEDELPIPVSAPKNQNNKAQAKAVVNKKQDLTDEADQYNPQVNRLKKKQLKNLQKEKKKGIRKVIPTGIAGDPDADYDFANDYGNGDDIDVDEIDMD